MAALEVIGSMLAPVVIDGAKRLINRFTGGVQPQTIDELAKLNQIEIDKLKALAELDRPVGEPSQWVVDLRASFRYIFIAVVWLVTGIAAVTNAPKDILMILLELSGMCLGFVIGERFVLKLNK